MRSREMMTRLARLPIRRGGEEKPWEVSLLSPEEQDRFNQLSDLILASKDIHSKALDAVFMELHELVRDLPRLGPNERAQGPLIKGPRELAGYWEFRDGASKWRSLAFHKLTKVQTLRFVELCLEYGFTDDADIPVKEQLLPLDAWTARDREELQHLLDIAAS